MNNSELSKIEFFIASNFHHLNGLGYKAADIRTYTMPPLAKTPMNDIAIHLSVPDDEKGRFSTVRTNIGTFLGDGTAETDKKAERSILHFPTPSIIDIPKGIVKLESPQLPCLYPSWMLSRYNIDGNWIGLDLIHATPLFLDKNSKKFLYFFDESFLDEIDYKHLIEDVSKDYWQVYKGKDGRKHLALCTHDFSDLLNLNINNTETNPLSEAFCQIRAKYEALVIDASTLDKVIVVQYQYDDVQQKPLMGQMPDGHRRAMSLFFFRAARHRDTYYRIDAEGKVDTQVSVPVIRSKEKDRGRVGEGFADTLKNVSTTVIPFTEQDWNHLVDIKDTLDSVQNTLWGLFKGCESTDESDRSLAQSRKSLSSPEVQELLGRF